MTLIATMDSTPPPLVGFNNNVRYRGMRFHIQTEDSGVTRPHIITHLFADGGHVIKSVRTDYSEYVNRPDRPAVVSKLMRDQHRAMALDLRDGRLDEKIDGLSPADSEAPPTEAGAPPASRLAEESSPDTRGPMAHAEANSGREPEAAAPASRPADPGKKRGRASTTPRKRSQPPTRKAGRPSAALPNKLSGESIFGTAPQESLDDVILGYVTTTKNGPATRRSK
jgi:hypothetical protein